MLSLLQFEIIFLGSAKGDTVFDSKKPVIF